VLVPQGGTVSFTATGTGKPPLTFRWRVVSLATGNAVATLLGATMDWVVVDPPGAYNVFLDLSNSAGSMTPLPTAVIVEVSPSFIFGDGFELELSRWLTSP
jgi:hypothetical protein